MACTETIIVRCPDCNSDCNSENIKRNGKSKTYRQRYVCTSCARSFSNDLLGHDPEFLVPESIDVSINKIVRN